MKFRYLAFSSSIYVVLVVFLELKLFSERWWIVTVAAAVFAVSLEFIIEKREEK